LTPASEKEKLFIVLKEAKEIQGGKRTLTRKRLISNVTAKYQIDRAEAKALVRKLLDGNMLHWTKRQQLRVSYPIEFLRL